MAHNLTSLTFTTEKTKFQCSAIPYGCDPPLSACARDPDTGRSFCCDRHVDGNLCWNDIAACASDGSTFSCERAGYKWCCMSKRESCDPTRANDCISTVRKPLLDIEPPALSKAYSSLSAAQTGATYLSFDPLALVAPAAPDPPSRDSLGGGAIAGIVVGAIGAVLLGLLVWLLWRKQRRLEGRTRSSTGATAAGMEDVHKTHSELPPSGGSGSPAPVSTDHGYHASELPVREYGQGASELPAQHHGHGASELHEEPTAAYIVEAPTYSAR